MTTLKYLSFSFSITFLSMGLGAILNALLKDKAFYAKISEFEFFKSDFAYQILGVKYMKWLVRDTFWHILNPKLKITKRPTVEDLKFLRSEMISAEVSHLLAFCLLCLVSIVFCFAYGVEFAFILLITNILMNLYPALLQQKNKSRISRILKV